MCKLAEAVSDREEHRHVPYDAAPDAEDALDDQLEELYSQIALQCIPTK